MQTDYENCRSNLEKLHNYYNENCALRNEATTRLQLIDRLFFDCLGWFQADVKAEEGYLNEYTDYVFTLNERKILIVEAKKEGDYFELPVGTEKLEYQISSLTRDYPSLKAALNQVSDYCQHRGVQFGAVANGHQLVIFIASRNDGLEPLKGRALVFPSILSMKENFLDLWKYLSKPGMQECKLHLRLTGNKTFDLPLKLANKIRNYPGIKNRNSFQADLKLVSEFILEDIIRHPQLEADFLEQCYCQNNALSQYSLISKAILQNRYDALFKVSSSILTILPAVNKKGVTPEIFAESLSRRPILLIGDVGVGKSTFIKHLIKIDATDIIKNSYTLYIDLGSNATLSKNFQEFIPDEISRQLLDIYEIDIQERNFIRGIYHSDICRFKNSIYSDLQKQNPTLYIEKEITFLERKINDKEQHLKAALEHISKGRKKQVIIFIDNTDQRDYSIQQQAFLIAQEFAEHWPLTVFIALRPETFYQSKKQGALSGYHAKAFTISPPRVDMVIKKRLQFALKIANGGEFPMYGLQDFKLKMQKLNVIIKIFLDSINENKELTEFIDNICSGNVRLALDLVRDFFGSGHVNMEKILSIYESGGRYIIPLHEFERAVIYEDAEHYDPSQSLVANLFDITYPDPKEHFILPLFLAFLCTNSTANLENGFVEIATVYEKLQNLGYVPDQIDAAINRGLNKKLLEVTYNPMKLEKEITLQALRITTVGSYHIIKLCYEFTYIDAIIVDTPILDPQVRDLIADVKDISLRLKRTDIFLDYLSSQWDKSSNPSTIFNWEFIANALKVRTTHIANKL